MLILIALDLDLRFKGIDRQCMVVELIEYVVLWTNYLGFIYNR